MADPPVTLVPATSVEDVTGPTPLPSVSVVGDSSTVVMADPPVTSGPATSVEDVTGQIPEELLHGKGDKISANMLRSLKTRVCCCECQFPVWFLTSCLQLHFCAQDNDQVAKFPLLVLYRTPPSVTGSRRTGAKWHTLVTGQCPATDCFMRRVTDNKGHRAGIASRLGDGIGPGRAQTTSIVFCGKPCDILEHVMEALWSADDGTLQRIAAAVGTCV
jgi:hypothetical protein